MCIVCISEDFLHHFSLAHREMKKATQAMLKVSQNSYTPELAKNYDKVHKKMLRVMKQWARIEQERELKPNSH